MNKLFQLLSANPVEFGAAFDATECDSVAPIPSPNASVWLEGGVAFAGAGFVIGDGLLSYEGRQYALRFSGLAVPGSGAAHISAVGNISNLDNLSEFGGSYLVCHVRPAAPGAGIGVVLKNELGVEIRLSSAALDEGITMPVNVMRLEIEGPL